MGGGLAAVASLAGNRRSLVGPPQWPRGPDRTTVRGMNCSSFAAAGFTAMALGVALPSVASATDYCVAPKSDCQANANTFQTLQGALDQAASTQEADRVLLGPATYLPEAGKGPFSYPSKAAPVEIVGAGRGKTVLTTSNLTDHQVPTARCATSPCGSPLR